MPVFQILNHIYLNKFNGCYEKIIILNRNPNDEKLKPFLKTIRNEKLSEFQSFDCCNKQKHCIQAFINPKTKQFIHKDEIDVLFSLLIDQDYTIQYEMTKMFNNNNNNNNPNLICFISKN